MSVQTEAATQKPAHALSVLAAFDVAVLRKRKQPALSPSVLAASDAASLSEATTAYACTVGARGL